MTIELETLNRIELVELHDARIVQVTLHRLGKVTIDLAHVCTYERVDTDHFEIVDYCAELLVTGVTGLAFSGSLEPPDRVIDVKVDSELLDPRQAARMLVTGTTKTIKTLRVLHLGSPELVVTGSSFALSATSRGNVLETWEGSLDTST